MSTATNNEALSVSFSAALRSRRMFEYVGSNERNISTAGLIKIRDRLFDALADIVGERVARVNNTYSLAACCLHDDTKRSYYDARMVNMPCENQYRGFYGPDNFKLSLSYGEKNTTIAGKFAKRLRKLLYLQGYSLPDKVVAEIGELATRYTEETATRFIFSFTRKLDWKDGDFADSGSCYWGGYEHARTDILPDNGAHAILFWEPAEYDAACAEYGREAIDDMSKHERLEHIAGIGRAWIVSARSVPDMWVPGEVDSNGLHTLFNIYTNSKALRRETIREALATTFRIPCGIATADFTCMPDGALYVNGSAGNAIVIGSEANSVAVELDYSSYAEPIRCASCECGLGEYDVTYNEHGEPYCDECYCQRYSSCNDCGCEVDNDYGVLVNGSDIVCETCAQDYSVCDDCGEYVSDTVHVADSDEHVCETCAQDCSVCDDCGEHVRTTSEVIDDGGEVASVCDDCLTFYDTCDDCKKPCSALTDENVCDDCAADRAGKSNLFASPQRFGLHARRAGEPICECCGNNANDLPTIGRGYNRRTLPLSSAGIGHRFGTTATGSAVCLSCCAIWYRIADSIAGEVMRLS